MVKTLMLGLFDLPLTHKQNNSSNERYFLRKDVEMPLFRFHRGSLEDSLKTTVIVKTKEELSRILKENDWDFDDLRIVPYPLKDHNFDERIGWYTHIVFCQLNKAEFPVGFLSENL